MKSQTFFFNKAFYKSNMKRYGIFAVLFFVATATISNIAILSNYSEYSPEYSYDLIYEMFSTPWDIAMGFIVPVLFSIALFRYLMDERSLAAIHAMPLSRKSLYFTQWVTFITLYGVPVVANGFIGVLILMVKGYPTGMVLAHGFTGIGLLLLLGVVIFGITTFMGMLVGSSVLQVAITYLLMGAPVTIVELSSVLLRWSLKGYPENYSSHKLNYYLTPYFSGVYMFIKDDTFSRGPIYALIAIICIAFISTMGAYYLYKKRPLEGHTELILFPLAKTILSGVLTLMLTLGLSTLIGEIISGGDTSSAYIGLVLGSLIGFTVMKMIAEKTVSVWQYWKQGLLVIVGFVLALVIIDLDLMGYESRQPDIEDIDYIYYNEDRSLEGFTREDMESMLNVDRASGGIFYDLSSMEKIMNLHKATIDDVKADLMTYETFELVYVMKNGRTLHRYYYQDVPVDLLVSIHEMPEFRANYISGISDLVYDGKLDEVSIYSALNKDITVPPSAYASLLTAFTEDYSEVTYNEVSRYDNFATIEIRLVSDTYYDRNGDLQENIVVYNVPIYATFDRVKAWMVLNGMADSVPDLERISRFEIYEDNQNKYYYDDIRYSDVVVETALPLSEEVDIYDRDLIKVLYELKPDYSRMGEQAYIVQLYFEGGGLYQYRVVDLPNQFLDFVSYDY